MNRREFLTGSVALCGLGGCRSLTFGEKPALRLGILSDLHVSTPATTAKFRRALRYFRSRGADAVVVAGDLSDYGLKSGLRYVKEAWDAEMAGSGIRPIFITGNHDFDGWWYGDITLDMHLNGYSEDEALSRAGMAKCWQETFGEAFAPVRMREVNGFRFVSVEWPGEGKSNDAEAVRFLEDHAAELAGPKPFFFVRHVPFGSTVGGFDRDNGNVLRKALTKFPNAVCLTGHIHWTLLDERSIWQGEFTAVSVPSMEYTTMPPHHENGCDFRKANSTKGMRLLPARADGKEAQGYFASVHADRIVFERHDFEEDVEVAEPWILPLPLGVRKPYAPDARARCVPVPQFPAGADVALRTVNDDTRQGRWTILFELGFPAASAEGGRVFDYEIRAVAETGRVHAVKRYLSPAFYKPEGREPARQAFLFDGMDVPDAEPYHFEIVPRNSFEVAGRPLRSRTLRSAPGKDISKGINWRQFQ